MTIQGLDSVAFAPLVLPSDARKTEEAPAPIPLKTRSGARQLRALDSLSREIRQAAEGGAAIQSTEIFRDTVRKFRMRLEDGREYVTTVLESDFSVLPQKGDRMELLEEWVVANQTDQAWFQFRNQTTGKTYLFSGTASPKPHLEGEQVKKINDIRFIKNEHLFANFFLNGMRMNIEIPSERFQHYYDQMPLIDKNEYTREESPDGKRFRIHAIYYHPIEKKDVVLTSDWLSTENIATIAGSGVANLQKIRDDWNGANRSRTTWDFKIHLTDGAQLVFRGTWPYFEWPKGQQKEDEQKIKNLWRSDDQIQILSSQSKNETTQLYLVKNIRTGEQREMEGPRFWLDPSVPQRFPPPQN